MKKPTYVEVVVKVPKIKYEAIINHNTEWDEWTLETIRNGILLPKGHGDLIDRDELLNSSCIWEFHRYDDYSKASKIIKNMPTIIEADKENKE